MKDVLLMTIGAVVATVAGLVPDWLEHRRFQRQPEPDPLRHRFEEDEK